MSCSRGRRAGLRSPLGSGTAWECLLDELRAATRIQECYYESGDRL